MNLTKIWLVLACFQIILGLLYRGNVLDIQVHDTYFVVSSFHLGILTALVCMLFGGLYSILARFGVLPNTILQIMQILSFSFLHIWLFIGISLGYPNRYDSFLSYFLSPAFYLYAFLSVQALFCIGILQKILTK